MLATLVSFSERFFMDVRNLVGRSRDGGFFNAVISETNSRLVLSLPYYFCVINDNSQVIANKRIS